MNVENDKVEPVTDLGLALGYSGQCTQRKLNNDSGAGANAASRVDMKFVASDPLSELVWSPRNGLSLKCADCSFTDKKSSPLWYDRPSNIVLSPSQNLTAGRSSADKPTNKDNFIVSQGAFCVRSEMAGKDTSASIPESDVAVKPVCELDCEDMTDEGKLDFIRYEPSSANPTGEGRDTGHENQTSRMVIVLNSEVHPRKECEANNTLVQNLASPGRGHERSFLGKESKSNMAMAIGDHPLERLESTSDNDVLSLISENVYGAEKKIVATESTHGIKYGSQQNEGIMPKDKTISGENSPTNSRIPMFQRKDKEKVLSDGDVNGRMSKEDDDSHESVESCNSTGLFSTGKKRWSFEQQLIVGSKRVKKQINESPGSVSHTKQDSSFMNWISNMMKGFSKTSQDDIPSLALTLAHPDHGQESPGHKLVKYDKNQESGCRKVGFQSIFQSLYCSNTKVVERTMDNNYQTELDLGNRHCDISSATSMACHGDNNNLCKQFLISNENFNESTSENEADPAIQPRISSANIPCSQENSKGNSEGNKNSCNMAAGKVQGGTNSSSCLDKHKTSSTHYTNSKPPSEAKTTHNFGHGNDPLGSFWITRFTPKPCLPLLKLQSSSAAHECATNYHDSHCNDFDAVEAGPLSIKDPPIGVAQESENCAEEFEASAGFNRIKGHTDQKSVPKLNPILPSQRFKNSLPSGFARKLNAFKHIMPSYDDAACATITCFFCGKKGHHLQHCLEIADNELEYLLRNISSYNGAEELPCLCIRCFQINHWAVACPNASSRVQNQLECGIQLNIKNEECTKHLDDNKSPFQASSAHTVCDPNDQRLETDPGIKLRMTEGATSDRIISDENLVNDYNPSSSGKLKESQVMPLCNLVNKQISELLKGIFDAIIGLRLSRTDILKWMTSHLSLAHLNGFYLRLRLGKWEEGLGGTGYYVACITGVQREGSKNSVSVNVGGIKCLVESQYISNHDFLEEELMAWWSATAKSGNNTPSEEELRIKLEERKMLGL